MINFTDAVEKLPNLSTQKALLEKDIRLMGVALKDFKSIVRGYMENRAEDCSVIHIGKTAILTMECRYDEVAFGSLKEALNSVVLHPRLERLVRDATDWTQVYITNVKHNSFVVSFHKE